MIISLALIAVSINATVLISALNERNIVNNEKNEIIKRELTVSSRERLLENVDVLEADISDLSDRKSKAEKETQQAEKTLEKFNQNIQLQKDAITQRDNAEAATKLALDNKSALDEGIKALKASIAENTTIKDNLTATIAVENNKLELLRSDIIKTKSDADIEKSRLEKLASDSAQKQIELDQLKASYQKAIGRYSALDENYKILDFQLSAKNAELEAKSLKLENVNIELQKLQLKSGNLTNFSEEVPQSTSN